MKEGRTNDSCIELEGCGGDQTKVEAMGAVLAKEEGVLVAP